MRRNNIWIVVALAALLIATVPLYTSAVDRTEVEQNAAIDRLNCAVFDEDCPEPTPEPHTATPEPTATDVPATATHGHATPEPVTLGWHPPGAHDGLNAHEHGITPPPQWVIDSGHAPFTQSRESHTGYKGVYATSPGGAQSYLIAHIVSNEAARAHGDHDYQLWIRDPDNGAVFYTDGVLCFAPWQQCTSPTAERTRDTGQRPIVLGERNATDGCETWYSDPADPNVPIDVGWTICGRYQAFDGTVLGGTGVVRTIDWIMPCSILPSGHSLRDECRTEFGVSRISWLVNTQQNDPAGVVRPVN